MSPVALAFVIDQSRKQLIEYSVSESGVGSQGKELPPGEEARWKRGRREPLALASLYCVLHKHVNSKLTEVSKPAGTVTALFLFEFFFSSLPHLLSQGRGCIV